MARRAVRARQRGSVLVEAAIIFPVLLMVTFGTIEYGLAFMSASTTSSATRSGARIASTAYAPAVRSGTANGVIDQVRLAVEDDLKALSRGTPVKLWMYRVDPSSPGGAPTGSPDFSTCTTSCIRWTWDGSHFAGRAGTWPSPTACGSTLDRVGIYVQVRHEPLTGFFGNGTTISEHTVMRIEPLPTDQCP
jgi:hypothetical protein